jgi:hypothetical protein
MSTYGANDHGTIPLFVWTNSCWAFTQQELLMTNGKNISQNEVAGFLLGLGIGLVVGLLFQPRVGNHSREFLGYNTAKAGTSFLPSPSGSRAVEKSLSSSGYFMNIAW